MDLMVITKGFVKITHFVIFFTIDICLKISSIYKQNQSIFAELYRTDTANLTTDGQRLVSNTFMIDIPEKLPEMSFIKSKTSNNQLITKINKEQITNLSR